MYDIFHKESIIVAETIISYYISAGKKKEPPKLSQYTVNSMAMYFAATAACELRHMGRFCKYIYAPGENVARWAKTHLTEFTNHDYGRKEVAKVLKRQYELYELDVSWASWLLKSASCIFGGEWKHKEEDNSCAYGGMKWAICCQRAANFLDEVSYNGKASKISWELWLNGVHNNGRWLSKLGDHQLVMGVLNAGAELDPQKFSELVTKYYDGRRSSFADLSSRSVKAHFDFLPINFDGLPKIKLSSIKPYKEIEYVKDEEVGETTPEQSGLFPDYELNQKVGAIIAAAANYELPPSSTAGAARA